MTITWKYIIISFIFGIITGIAITWLKKHRHVIKKINNNANQNDTKNKFLIDHFINVAILLHNITNQHYKLYEHIEKISKFNLPSDKKNEIFLKDKLQINNNTKENKKQPKDYPEIIDK